MQASGASSQGRSQVLPRLTSANSSRTTLGACCAPAAPSTGICSALTGMGTVRMHGAATCVLSVHALSCTEQPM